ncbi:hypothetical protein HDK77DRAFT_278775 [Phyllosticta capitalensis]
MLLFLASCIQLSVQLQYRTKRMLACLFVWRIYIDHTVLPFVCSGLPVAFSLSSSEAFYTICNVVGCCHAQFHANANAIRALVCACLTRDEKGKKRGK